MEIVSPQASYEYVWFTGKVKSTRCFPGPNWMASVWPMTSYIATYQRKKFLVAFVCFQRHFGVCIVRYLVGYWHISDYQPTTIYIFVHCWFYMAWPCLISLKLTDAELPKCPIECTYNGCLRNFECTDLLFCCSNVMERDYSCMMPWMMHPAINNKYLGRKSVTAIPYNPFFMLQHRFSACR